VGIVSTGESTNECLVLTAALVDSLGTSSARMNIEQGLPEFHTCQGGIGRRVALDQERLKG
jgi:hypothetical protein